MPLTAIRADLARSSWTGESHRKVWAGLRAVGDRVRVSRKRVLRLMREHALLSPHRARPRPEAPPTGGHGAAFSGRAVRRRNADLGPWCRAHRHRSHPPCAVVASWLWPPPSSCWARRRVAPRRAPATGIASSTRGGRGSARRRRRIGRTGRGSSAATSPVTRSSGGKIKGTTAARGLPGLLGLTCHTTRRTAVSGEALPRPAREGRAPGPRRGLPDRACARRSAHRPGRDGRSRLRSNGRMEAGHAAAGSPRSRSNSSCRRRLVAPVAHLGGFG